MKKILLTLLLLSSVNNKAQTIEPQWSINLYFEDANGETDMLTFGYDPSAGPYIESIDPQFGEQWVEIDTTKFNVYIQRNAGSGHPIYPPIDTNIVRKISIGSWPYPGIEFGWVHGKLPVTMTWDAPKLDSPDLPSYFIDESPCTRARIDMWYTPGYLSEPYCVNTVVDPYQPPTSTLLNNPNTEPCYVFNYCTFEGSITWVGWEDNQEICNSMSIPTLLVAPYKDFYWDPTIGIEDVKLNTKIYPNPTTDFLYIKNPTNNIIKIYDMLGKMVLQKNIKSNTDKIDVRQLIRGVYFLKTNEQTIKFIKK